VTLTRSLSRLDLSPWERVLGTPITPEGAWRCRALNVASSLVTICGGQVRVEQIEVKTKPVTK